MLPNGQVEQVVAAGSEIEPEGQEVQVDAPPWAT